MCLLPAALPALLAPVPRRWALGLMAAWTLAFVPPFFDRLRSFSSELALWDDAVRKNADRSAPLVERAYRNRGVAHYHDARYDAALQDFERALALDPGSAKAWLTRGTLFMRTGQTEKALADLDRAVTLDPSEHEALGRRCVVLMRLQRYDAALEDCRRALQLDAFDALNHTSLGMAHALRGEVAAAEASYLRALALEPASGDAHYQYATLLNGTGRKPEARLHFVAACRAGTPKACDMVLRIGPAQ
jgi:serine/threonine-protein kinase